MEARWCILKLCKGLPGNKMKNVANCCILELCIQDPWDILNNEAQWRIIELCKGDLGETKYKCVFQSYAKGTWGKLRK